MHDHLRDGRPSMTGRQVYMFLTSSGSCMPQMWSAHTHRTAPETTTTTTSPWLTLLTWVWKLCCQPCHSLMRLAWHKVGGSTLWTVLSGRLVKLGVSQGQRVGPMMGDLVVALGTGLFGVPSCADSNLYRTTMRGLFIAYAGRHWVRWLGSIDDFQMRRKLEERGERRQRRQALAKEFSALLDIPSRLPGSTRLVGWTRLWPQPLLLPPSWGGRGRRRGVAGR